MQITFLLHIILDLVIEGNKRDRRGVHMLRVWGVQGVFGGNKVGHCPGAYR